MQMQMDRFNNVALDAQLVEDELSVNAAACSEFIDVYIVMIGNTRRLV